MSWEYNFYNDYSEGVHPRILKALSKSNLNQEAGYGKDIYCMGAAELIKEKIGNPDAAVHFVSGGTQANIVVLASVMRTHEAVIAADTGHINVHEAGAIEATGHKVIPVKTKDGKLDDYLVTDIVESHLDEHMVKPKVVFISDATELGTVYAKRKLEDLSKYCKRNSLYLYLDGARLGSALTAKDSDLTLPELARLVDVFYIGGTKNGALLGEAIVINNPALQEDFRYQLKQRGALIAKGRILGVQFQELFRDDLYFDLARHANEMACQLKEGIAVLGYDFLVDSSTNQIFPIMPLELVSKLWRRNYGFHVWSDLGNSISAIRLVTSWATREKAVKRFLSDLEKLTT